jgi:predicted permease
VIGILLNVVGPVFLVALAGYVWAWSGRPFDAAFIVNLTLLIGAPFFIIDTLSQAQLSAATLATIATAALACHLLPMAIGWALLRLARQPADVFLPSLVFANTGNMGVPLCLFAFGEEGLALGVAYFAIGTLFNFTVGEWLAAGRLSWSDVLRAPLVWSTVIAMVLSVTGWQLPSVLARAIHLLGDLAVPLMLLSLGVSLSRLYVTSFRRSLLLACGRLFIGFGVGWLVATALGLDGVARGVVVIQSAMPVAVINYMFALRYERHPEEVAGIVVMSTLMSVGLLPLFLLTVRS